MKTKQEYVIKEMHHYVLDVELAIKIMQSKGLRKCKAGLMEDSCYDNDIELKGDKLGGDVDFSSTWATPSLKIETKLGYEVIPCSKISVSKYKEPVKKKIKVLDFLGGFPYELDSYYDEKGELQIDFPLSCAIRYNKRKKAWEMLTPHTCGKLCPCRTKWYSKKVKQ